MNFLSKRKFVLIVLSVSILLALFTCYKYLNHIEKKDMAEYVPASAAAFIEINSLSTLFSELLKTEAWQKLAPSFGISKQIEYLTSAADILTFTGLGPTEATLLARAQYAVVLDNLEFATTETDRELQTENTAGELEIIPRFALVIETQSRSTKVEEYLANRVALLAQRIYSNKVIAKEEVFHEIKIKVFESENQKRSIIAAQKGSVLIVGNSLLSVQNCLSVLLGKQPSFKNNPSLKVAREKMGNQSIVFGFITKETVSRILQIGTGFLPKLTAISNSKNQSLPSIISSELVGGLAYSASFNKGKVVERYFTLIKPEIMERINSAVQPTSKEMVLTPGLMDSSLDFTVLFVDKPSEFLEEIIKATSAHTDAVIGFALRQLIIELGKKYGIVPEDPISDLIDNEIALVKIPEVEKDEFVVMLGVNNRLRILPSVGRYLRKGNEKVNSEEYKGVEIVSNPDSEARAIAFLDDYLVLGTKNQLITFINLWQTRKLDQESKVKLSIIQGFPNAIFLSSKVEKRAVGDFFLSISRLLRTTDGAREILNNEPIRSLVAQIPPSLSVGELGNEGLMIETRSAIGVFVYLSMFFDNSANELQESQTTK
ncbi:MAG: hypothetical protein FD167_912 [bacterium]|nr:MAG: hypothetical protein FD167_912 [bacterium]